MGSIKVMKNHIDSIKIAYQKTNDFVDWALKIPTKDIKLDELNSQLDYLEEKTKNIKKYINFSVNRRKENSKTTKYINNYGYEIVSLGDNCFPRNLLSKFGLKKLKAEGELSYPFDLAIHPLSSSAKLISKNFQQYKKTDSLSIKFNHPINHDLNIMFNHERDPIYRENNYTALIDRYASRGNNFNNAITNKRIIFVLHCNSTHGIIELCKSLNDKLTCSDNHLIVIYTGKSLNHFGDILSTYNPSNFNIEIIHAEIPFTGYTWFKVDDYTSETGRIFEKKIIDKIENSYKRIIKKEILKNEIYSVKNTLENIRSLDYLEKIFYLLNTNIIDKIKTDSQGEGFNSYLKVCDNLSDLYFYYCNDIKINIENLSTVELFNFAFVFQSASENFSDNTFIRLLNLDSNVFKRLLCRKQFVTSLCKFIERDATLEVNSINLISLCFAVTSFRLYEPNDELAFLNIVKRIIKAGNNKNSSIVCNFISKRISTLNSIDIKQHKKAGRIALLITGQLRGYKEALPSVAEKFSSLSNIDIYVSTWEDIGNTKFSKERLDRIFEPVAVDWIKNTNNIDAAESAYNKLYLSHKVHTLDFKQELDSIFKDCNNIYINIQKDTDYPFCLMSNAEKMFYHNSFWLKSNNNICWENYDLIIKIRPDIYFPPSELHFDELNIENAIYTEDSNGWIYREWGFGIGDQLMYGAPSIMHGVMSLHGEAYYSEITKLLSSSGEKYLGHINCGLYAWANAKDCLPASIKHNRICSFKKITLSEVTNEKINC